MTPLLYKELRRIAGGHLRNQRPGHTLQPTALVHEAYLRLAAQTQFPAGDRLQFLALAAKVMRNILVDHARKRKSMKRAGGAHLTFNEELHGGTATHSSSLVQLTDALTSLSNMDPLKGRLIELRFFGGLTGAEIAEVTGISTASVTREMRLAEAWLYRELSSAAH